MEQNNTLKTIIIAEAGVNHNGSIDLAKRLVKAAADAGADFVKFQTFKAEKLVTKIAKKAEYQKVNTPDKNESQFGMLSKLELSEEDHFTLFDYSKECGINFFSTAFDEDSIDFLSKLNLEMLKIPSGEITNLPYLKRIAYQRKKTILSTGMATMDEIEQALCVLTNNGLNKNSITVLHCTTEYPAPLTEVNLRAMQHIEHQFGVKVGYSDHTLGIEVPIAAVALGASVIEKHFTMDRNMKGPDHKASLEPTELTAMVRSIRNVELAIKGNGLKAPSQSEIKNKLIARKSIHLAKDLPAGHIIGETDLIMKRPGNGISPMRMNEIIGRSLAITLKIDTMLELDHLVEK